MDPKKRTPFLMRFRERVLIVDETLDIEEGASFDFDSHVGFRSIVVDAALSDFQPVNA